MVGLDPLYLVDVNEKYITPTLDQFEPAYRNRVRAYVVDDQTDEPILAQLPQGQFGCVAEHNYFKYKSLSTVDRYLTEVFNLLRPGGTFIFTFPDGDNVKALELVEKFKATYLPGHLIRQKARELTYRIVQYTVNNGIAVVELQKPGVLSSIRGGQTLARIVPN
jgi:SAM-dependent methyltransferase